MSSGGQGKDGKASGFLDSLLGNLGIKKPAPPPLARRNSDQLQRSGRETNPMAGGPPKPTQALSEAEKAKQSEERRYLIAAYEATPTLIPEFQNPQYMYKLISNERDYVQESLQRALADRKKMVTVAGDEPDEATEGAIGGFDAKIQEHRNDLTRLFLLIKKVAGVQKSGTGGTDFLNR